MRFLTQKPIRILFLLVLVYSAYDYWEHISRPDSTFEAYPEQWLAFNLGVISSFILFVTIFKRLSESTLKRKSVLIEAFPIGLWLALYVIGIGPLLNKLLWPADQLYFSFRLVPTFILVVGSTVVRVFINLLVGKKPLYSN